MSTAKNRFVLPTLPEFEKFRAREEDLLDWAEEAIAQAQQRYPALADLLFHSFSMLLYGHMHQALPGEILNRAHYRELLERVATGQDTAVGTAAEVICVVHTVNIAGPVTGAAAGLYLRMWKAAGLKADPDHPDDGHYEALYGSQIDALEEDARERLREDQRIPEIDPQCNGTHLSKPAICRFARPDLPEQLRML